MRVLAADGDRPANVLLLVAAQVRTAKGDPSTLRIEEAEQEPDDRRLPGTASPEQHDPRARFEPEAEVVQRRQLPGPGFTPGCGRSIVEPSSRNDSVKG